MLLVLILVYLFHGFQIHAAPLTLLAESGSDATVLNTSACICPADQRSIWDILWSCLVTISACSWISVHPNIPGPNESCWKILLHRLELMFWAVVAPEMIVYWAFSQCSNARSLEKLYKERGWPKTHGYFIDMGGFMLFEGNVAKGVLSQERFSELIMEGKIEFPTITAEEM